MLLKCQGKSTILLHLLRLIPVKTFPQISTCRCSFQYLGQKPHANQRPWFPPHTQINEPQLHTQINEPTAYANQRTNNTSVLHHIMSVKNGRPNFNVPFNGYPLRPPAGWLHCSWRNLHRYSLPHDCRLSEWIAPAKLRSYDIAGIRVGACYASRRCNRWIDMARFGRFQSGHFRDNGDYG